ncbi:MAG TPA: MraY family glycosyltransferase [Elusimicrobiota bacterium]|nr:MraY family glycosyltransferase [Elusimicrobiota bacterium]
MKAVLSHWELYAGAGAIAAAISLLLTPAVRIAAVKLGWFDTPSARLKTHKIATPALGGVAIYCAFAATLIFLRYETQFPTGTLRSLRGLLIGGTLVFLLGLIDDLKKPSGLGFKTKFVVQAAAGAVLLAFGFRIHFIKPDYLAEVLTLVWIVGITNAFNIIDIMDGLSASQAAISALAFLLISLPRNEFYVNFASATLAGAAAGFLPWNFSPKRKIFMGDCGSLLVGFLLAGISLGTHYSKVNNLGVYAPIIILLVPMYDTLFVMALRIRQGLSPFLGSNDHFALRLERMGYSRHQIVAMAAGATTILGVCAFLATALSGTWAFCLYLMLAAEILILSRALARVAMRK